MIYRYAIKRKKDGKFYKNPSAIYENIESYWTDDISKARLWIDKSLLKDWNKKTFEIITFKLTIV